MHHASWHLHGIRTRWQYIKLYDIKLVLVLVLVLELVKKSITKGRDTMHRYKAACATLDQVRQLVGQLLEERLLLLGLLGLGLLGLSLLSLGLLGLDLLGWGGVGGGGDQVSLGLGGGS